MNTRAVKNKINTRQTHTYTNLVEEEEPPRPEWKEQSPLKLFLITRQTHTYTQNLVKQEEPRPPEGNESPLKLYVMVRRVIRNKTKYQSFSF